ncbi:hypothetical protein SGMN_05810 [Stenotrophomonas geniculata]
MPTRIARLHRISGAVIACSRVLFVAIGDDLLCHGDRRRQGGGQPHGKQMGAGKYTTHAGDAPMEGPIP